jgi:hypothetical protein
MDIAFIGRLTKVDYILHNAPTSRVRNPGPDLEHANQRGEAKPYNGIATIPMNAMNMSLYVYFQRLLFIVIQLLTSCVVGMLYFYQLLYYLLHLS